MSTKIYNGFRWDVADWQEALVKAFVFKPVLDRYAQEVLRRYLELPVGVTLADRWMSWIDRRNKMRRTNRRDPLVDTDFSLVLFPVAGLSVPGILGMVFTEQQAWQKAWLEQPGVCEYAYWDNTDEPEDMSLEDWQERKRNWGIALPDACAVPAMRGFSIELMDRYGPLPADAMGVDDG